MDVVCIPTEDVLRWRADSPGWSCWQVERGPGRSCCHWQHEPCETKWSRRPCKYRPNRERRPAQRESLRKTECSSVPRWLCARTLVTWPQRGSSSCPSVDRKVIHKSTSPHLKTKSILNWISWKNCKVRTVGWITRRPATHNKSLRILISWIKLTIIFHVNWRTFDRKYFLPA